MVLSRIWSAFVIIAIIVASIKMIGGDNKIFNRMVSGKSSDKYDSTFYAGIGSPENLKLNSNYGIFLSEYGYYKTSEITKATVLLHDGRHADSVTFFKNIKPSLETYSYLEVQKKLVRKVDGIIETAKNAVLEIIFPLIGILALFMGFLNIAEKAGGIRFLSRLIGPFFSKIFPDVPSGHPATGHMMMNFSANLLNLDNAATPFGLKAMESLQELNPNKAVASNAQIMFLVLNTSGLTIIPVTIMAQRAIMGAANPSDVFIPILISTYFSTLTGLLAVA